MDWRISIGTLSLQPLCDSTKYCKLQKLLDKEEDVREGKRLYFPFYMKFSEFWVVFFLLVVLLAKIFLGVYTVSLWICTWVTRISRGVITSVVEERGWFSCTYGK